MHDDAARGFLPDFCSIRSVFAVVLTGELLAFVLTLVRPAPGWPELGLISIFVQWIALASAAALCLLRPALAGLSGALAGSLAYAVVVGITVVVAFAASYLEMPVMADGGRLVFLLRASAIGAIVAAVVLRYLYVQHQWRERLRASADARIDALQARIRPHFLFNSLNTIAALIATAPAQAERLVEDLADLFRAALSRDERLVALAGELELGEGYLRMEALRLGERLHVQRDLEGLPPDALIPPLTLQPLLENAVYYGIEPRERGGTIYLGGRRQGGELVIQLANPEPSTAGRGSRGSGMAQANVRERLALAFPDAGRLEVSTRDGVYHVTVRIPYRRDSGSHESSHRR